MLLRIHLNDRKDVKDNNVRSGCRQEVSPRPLQGDNIAPECFRLRDAASRYLSHLKLMVDRFKCASAFINILIFAVLEHWPTQF